MIKGAIWGTGIAALVGSVIALARYGRSRFAKECQNLTPPDFTGSCQLTAGDFGFFTSVGMGLRALTGGNVYTVYAPQIAPPGQIMIPPGQAMPPGQVPAMIVPTQAGPQQTTSAS